MTKIIWCCLLLAPFYSFAQNIDLKDISQMLHTRSVDSISQQLQKNGFLQGRVNLETNKGLFIPANTWSFRPGINPDLKASATLYKSIDSTGTGVRLETDNPWFYAHLMNQLPEQGFKYQETIVSGNNAVLNFSNEREVLTISISNNTEVQSFRFTLKENNHATASR